MEEIPEGNQKKLAQFFHPFWHNLATALVPRSKIDLYYYRKKYPPPCNYLHIGALRLPTLARHQPITYLIPS